MVTNDEFEKSVERARHFEARTPKAISARYDRHSKRVVIRLTSNLGIFFSPRDAEGLEDASPAELENIEISPSGYGIHFPKLDADLYLPALLEGVFGSERWIASRMGRRGGRSRSEAKAAAARANGRKGGRPKQKETAALGNS